MKIEIKEASSQWNSLIEFTMPNGIMHQYLMPTVLAETIKARFGFKHSIYCDGNLVAAFKQDQDRDVAFDVLEDLYGFCEWGKVDA